MKSAKLRTLLLGVLASLLLLYFLDPLVPDFGLVALRKSSGQDVEHQRLLSTLASSTEWARFQVLQIPDGTVTSNRKRTAEGENLINLKYALMAPNSKIRDAITVRLNSHAADDTVFDVIYTTDQDSRRTTIPVATSTPKFQIAFLGDSFTWGSGVGDGETFSSNVARRLPQARVINLGIRGGAPNDFIDDFVENPKRLEKKGVAKGVVVLTLLADHIERALCKTRCYTEPVFFKGDVPLRPLRLDKTRYTLENGKLESAGRFRDEGAWLTNLKIWIFKSRILTKVYYDYSGYPSRDDLFLFAKMVERIRDLIAERTGYDFVVAFFPEFESRSSMKVLKIFDELHISYFDYSNLKFDEALGGRGFYAIDRHPTALGHAAYAELLLKDLRQRTPALFETN